jgi:hypothetical protein
MLIVLVALLIASCDPLLSSARIGLTRTPSGQPVILFTPCPEESAERVSLRSVRDNLGGTDDIILWELVADPSAVQGEPLIAIPGRTPPPRFHLSVNLSEPLPSDRVLTVAIHHSREPAFASSFRLDQLREGQILSDIGTYMSRSEYLDLARDTCDNELNST